MNKDNTYRFAMIFSGGKDSAIAMNQMIREGNTPVCLVVGTNQWGISHMHNMRPNLVKQYGDALGLPVVTAPMEQKYDFNVWRRTFEILKDSYNVQAVCTGDIAFAYSRENMIEIAKSYEMEAFSPLWGISEEELIKEILQFEIIIKSLATDIGLNDLLGKRLNMDAITRLHEKGLMLSEDTSDLHTLAVDGPIFKHPLQYRIGELFEGEYYSKVDVHYL